MAPDGSVNPYFASLQDRIDQVQSNSSSGLLQVLQSRGGVTENTPNVKLNLVLGAAGGLVLGILAALGLAALSTRPTDSAHRRETTVAVELVAVERASLQTEGNRPQGWMSAPVIATLVLVVLMFLQSALQGVLPNKVFLVMLLVVVIATALWIDANPHTIARHRSG